jgi:hypothetical protein
MRPLVLGQDRLLAKETAKTVAKLLVRSVNFVAPISSS